jgi:hypothetical protein
VGFVGWRTHEESALDCPGPDGRSAMVKATLRLIFVASLCVGLTGCAEIVRGLATEAIAALLKEATRQPKMAVAGKGESCANSSVCAGQLLCNSGRCATYTPYPALSTQMDKPCATSQDCERPHRRGVLRELIA